MLQVKQWLLCCNWLLYSFKHLSVKNNELLTKSTKQFKWILSLWILSYHTVYSFTVQYCFRLIQALLDKIIRANWTWFRPQRVWAPSLIPSQNSSGWKCALIQCFSCFCCVTVLLQLGDSHPQHSNSPDYEMKHSIFCRLYIKYISSIVCLKSQLSALVSSLK